MPTYVQLTRFRKNKPRTQKFFLPIISEKGNFRKEPLKSSTVPKFGSGKYCLTKFANLPVWYFNKIDSTSNYSVKKLGKSHLRNNAGAGTPVRYKGKGGACTSGLATSLRRCSTDYIVKSFFRVTIQVISIHGKGLGLAVG
jgi:hypothetical protein